MPLAPPTLMSPSKHWQNMVSPVKSTVLYRHLQSYIIIEPLIDSYHSYHQVQKALQTKVTVTQSQHSLFLQVWVGYFNNLASVNSVESCTTYVVEISCRRVRILSVSVLYRNPFE